MIFGLYTRKELEREYDRRFYEESRFRNIGEELSALRKEIEGLHREMFDLRSRVEPQAKTPTGSCCREG